MKKLLTLLLSLSVFSAMGQYQSEAFIKQQEKLQTRYTRQQTVAISVGAVSALSWAGYFITLGSKPVYTYTGNNSVIAAQQYQTYTDQMNRWKTIKTSFLIGGAATGVTSIIFGVLSGHNKHLYDTNKMTLNFTPNNGIGLCLRFKAY